MADTVKDVRDRIEVVSEKLREHIDSKIEDVGSKIEKIAEDIGEVTTEVAAINATIAAAKLIGLAASIVVAVLGGLGVWQIIETQLKISKEQVNYLDLTKQSKELLSEHSKMIAADLIENLDSDINSEGSLDDLKNKPQLDRIHKRAEELRNLQSKLGENDKTDYYKIAPALDYYLANNCSATLSILKDLSLSDQNHFGYAYMRGACLLRSNETAEARRWLEVAFGLTEGNRVLMTMNAQGVVNLALWKASQNLKFLESARVQFENLTISHPEFAPGYANLACAYSQLKQYDKVSDILLRFHRLRTIDDITKIIGDDMLRGSEQYFSNYVNEALDVSVQVQDGQWKSQVSTKLSEALAKAKRD